MTEEHINTLSPEMRLDRDDFIDAWVKISVIKIGGPLHRFVPKEPAWCQVLGNKLDLVLWKQMSVRPFDQRRVLAALQKHLKRLNYVYTIAAQRRQVHLAKQRLRRKQAKCARHAPDLTGVGGGHHG